MAKRRFFFISRSSQKWHHCRHFLAAILALAAFKRFTFIHLYLEVLKEEVRGERALFFNKR